MDTNTVAHTINIIIIKHGQIILITSLTNASFGCSVHEAYIAVSIVTFTSASCVAIQAVGIAG